MTRSMRIRTSGFLLGGLLVFFVSPCRGQEAKAGKDAKEVKHYVEPYYPIADGSKWTYQVIDHKAPKTPGAKKQLIVLVAEKGEPVAWKKKDSAETTEWVATFNLRVYDHDKAADKKSLYEQVALADDGVYRLSGAGKKIEPYLCFLKKAPSDGMSWECKSTSENAELKGGFVVSKDTIAIDAPVLKGPLPAIKVRSVGFHVGGQELHVESWYVQNVGMVRQRVKVGNHDIELILEDYQPRP
ncbi:MAG: hypothetical protein NZO58_00565 [Gemmataceae bacterium]|nr:hypothetical protein [Gemmataceae bacterium]